MLRGCICRLLMWAGPIWAGPIQVVWAGPIWAIWAWPTWARAHGAVQGPPYLWQELVSSKQYPEKMTHLYHTHCVYNSSNS